MTVGRQKSTILTYKPEQRRISVAPIKQTLIPVVQIKHPKKKKEILTYSNFKMGMRKGASLLNFSPLATKKRKPHFTDGLDPSYILPVNIPST